MNRNGYMFWRLMMWRLCGRSVAIFSMILVLSCSRSNSDSRSNTELKSNYKADTNQEPRDVATFYDGFETGYIDKNEWRIEANQEGFKSIQVVKNPLDEDQKVVKVTLRAGDIVNSGTRAELSRDNHDPYMSEVYYSWRFMFDADYQESESWQVIGQWHDQPDWKSGETWKKWSGHGKSPPLKIEYNDGFLWIVATHRNEEKYPYYKKKIKFGEWIHLVFHFKWSLDENGFVEAWLNGENFTPFNGKDHKMYTPTLSNKAGNYLKIGLYRDAISSTTGVVYFDDVKIGKSYSEVAD